MKLIGSSMSPFVERVILAMEIKGTPDVIEMADAPGGFKSPEHHALSPMGRIPILVTDEGEAIAESQAIVDYLDDVVDGPSLIPSDPMAKAQLSTFCRVIDMDFVPAWTNLWPNRAPSEEALKEAVEVKLPKAMDYLEFYAEKVRLSADSPTIADAALIPFLFHMRVFGKKLGCGDFGDRPILSSWHKAVSETDMGKASFERCSVALQKFR